MESSKVQEFLQLLRDRISEELTNLNPDDLEDFIASCLDEVVHDLKSGEAAAINNDGTESQAEYILANSGDQTLEQILTGIWPTVGIPSEGPPHDAATATGMYDHDDTN